jgi:hypothetical protein
MPMARLRIDRSEVGQLALKVGERAYFGIYPTGAGEHDDPLVLGQNPGATKPENASANRSLCTQPPFRRLACPRFAASAARPDVSSGIDLNSPGQLGPEPRQVRGPDGWEAVHRAPGLNFVADAYSHFYLVPRLRWTTSRCWRASDQTPAATGGRWKKEDGFLLCRSTSSFWDRQKEVPNQRLSRWQQDNRQGHELPLEDLLEVPMLADQQLGSATVGKLIEHWWGLEEQGWSAIPQTQSLSARGPFAQPRASWPGSPRACYALFGPGADRFKHKPDGRAKPVSARWAALGSLVQSDPQAPSVRGKCITRSSRAPLGR